MLSRVAESLYWMARYIERAENVARFIDAHLHALLDHSGVIGTQWEPLVQASGNYALFLERYGREDASRPGETRPAARADVIQFLTFDAQNPDSIVSCVQKARENARTVRGHLPSEMWESLNRLHIALPDGRSRRSASDTPGDFFTEVRMACHLFFGIAEATFSRGEGWHFLKLGQHLERADQTTRLLDVKYFLLFPKLSDVGSVVDDLVWAGLLHSVSGYEAFRRRHGRMEAEKVVDFLLLDPFFPRAVLHGLTAAESSLLALSGTAPGTYSNPAERALSRLRSDLAYSRTGEILAEGLHEFLDGLQRRLNRAGGAIFETFFAFAPAESLAGGQQ